tara:strand:+ start:173 stop:787 length:615 start_codon:yes stop_codon:yes gene_type:complete
MPLPVIAVVAARLGIKLATYMIGKQLKKGAAKKLRKAITKKRAEKVKEKTAAGKKFIGEGSKRKLKTVTQRKSSKVDPNKQKKKPKNWPGSKKQQTKGSLSKKREAFEKKKRIAKNALKAVGAAGATAAGLLTLGKKWGKNMEKYKPPTKEQKEKQKKAENELGLAILKSRQDTTDKIVKAASQGGPNKAWNKKLPKGTKVRIR